MKKNLILSIFVLFVAFGLNAQNKEYQVTCVAFYNLENLFDTIDSPDARDTEFTPGSDKVWNTERYYEKLDHMADVISKIGTETTPDGPAVIGLCEIENRLVLEDLIKTEKLKSRDYKIVHYQSPDYRGIDVALLYQSKYFELENSTTYELNFPDNPKYKTREQLVVSGFLNGEKMHFIVNHWPSRRGGEKKSRSKRNAAGALSRTIIDSIQKIEPEAKIMVMGDLNDDPINQSVKKFLKAKGEKKSVKEGELFNPWYKLYKKGIGTLAYRDSWNLFDQIILSKPMIEEVGSKYTFYKAKVFNKNFLKQAEGRFKGYPFRTYVGSTYMGGYSDHFPSYIFLIREKQ